MPPVSFPIDQSITGPWPRLLLLGNCLALALSFSVVAQTAGNTTAPSRERAQTVARAGAKTITEVAKSNADFTRKSEGDVIELTDGRLLLVYMEFSGDGSDFAKTRLVAQESADGGRTWGKHRVVTKTSPGDMNVYSPNLIRSKNGDILLMFMRQHRPGALTNYVWKSTDEGVTYTPLSEFTAGKDYSLCNATVKRLASGRLLLPASPPVPGKPAETGPY
ncbi:MAG: sialidase family protein, partial [Planctomycetota bacterium]|nr:sialidase family protein [Planctomycetota bacterium]